LFFSCELVDIIKSDEVEICTISVLTDLFNQKNIFQMLHVDGFHQEAKTKFGKIKEINKNVIADLVMFFILPIVVDLRGFVH
jgi:hypothetical protein